MFINDISRLTFNNSVEWSEFISKNTNLYNNIWLWHETLGNREYKFDFPGICDLCESQTLFSATPVKSVSGISPINFTNKVNWWWDTNCNCLLSNCDRAVFNMLMRDLKPNDVIYNVGYYSRFRERLSERIPNIISSQYFEDMQSGEFKNGIRCEDITRLSFPENNLDSIVCMDVLEHVSDYKRALFEMCRVLKPSGSAYITVPWLGGNTYKNLTRAELKADGSVIHHLEPEYHGDPASSSGILSYRSFGWELLDELRDAGFGEVKAAFIFNPLFGYMSLLNPVIVAKK